MNTREIHGHEVNDANRELVIKADDRDPENGNASHVYTISIKSGPPPWQRLSFQYGPIEEVGVNGITNEALLAILIDRLHGFQTGKYACTENANALTSLEDAFAWLQERAERESKCVMCGKRESKCVMCGKPFQGANISASATCSACWRDEIIRSTGKQMIEEGARAMSRQRGDSAPSLSIVEMYVGAQLAGASQSSDTTKGPPR